MTYLNFSTITDEAVQRILKAAPECLICHTSNKMQYAVIMEGEALGAGILFCAECHSHLYDTEELGEEVAA